MEINKTEELLALSKVLQFIKYECKDYEAAHLAGSPVIGKIFKEVVESLDKYYKQLGIKRTNEWPEIKSVPFYISVIQEHIKNTDAWSEITLEV
jgi:hypothetical protein